MRKLFLALVLTLFCAVFFISCQKEIDPSILTGPQNDSTYVSKIIELDTTLPSGADTVWINYYFYDSQKRLWRVKESEYDATGEIWSDTIEYRYQGTQTLPINYRYLDGTNPDSNVFYLTYSNGFIVMDSNLYYSSGVPMDAQVTRLSPAGGNQYLKKTYVHNMINPNPPILTLDSVMFTRTIAGGNIVFGMDSVWGTGFFTTKYTFQYSYDNKHSIFKDLQVWYLGYYQDLITTSAGYLSNNVLNATETEENSLGSFPENFTYSYTYRSDGYPIIARLNSSVSVYSNKVIIKYTKL